MTYGIPTTIAAIILFSVIIYLFIKLFKAVKRIINLLEENE